MTQKTRKIIGWVLTGILTLVLVGSAFMKLTASEEVVKNAEGMGLTADALRLIGALEILCIIVFIVPRTGLLGTLLVAAYLGGAIVTHIEHQQPFIVPIVIQALVFVTAAIRFPELTKRLMGRQVA